MPILGVISSSSRRVPNAPTIGTATDVGTGRAYNNGAATVTFTAPTFDGGLPITGYTVTSSPGGYTASGASSPLTVAGLQSNTNYTFTVTATNAVGQSAASAASNSILATTIPQAPTIGTATDGGTGSTVSVAFTPGATGGKAVSTYTATSSPGGLTGTGASSPITVSGLTAGTAYTFTVTATNANGTSSASAASNSVTPVVPSSFDSIATFTGNNTTPTYTFSSIPQTYKSLQLRINGVSSSGGTSYIYVRFNGDTGSNYNAHGIFIQSNAVVNFGQTTTTSTVIGGLQISNTPDPLGIIADLVDYSSTSKFKTIKSAAGIARNATGNYDVNLLSGLWRSTSAVNSITVFTTNNDWDTGSSIALYGIKG
jgi:hypothetical protein